ncbi:MAG: hypothetical protein WC654_04425 [Patescibacteria group bacterium]
MRRNKGKYKKPEVTTHGSNPESVESGCCLRSCGGSPAPASVTDKGTRDFVKKIKEEMTCSCVESVNLTTCTQYRDHIGYALCLIFTS